MRLTHIRRAQCSPMCWHKGQGILLDKGDKAKEGPGAWRIVTLVDPFGKAFAAALMATPVLATDNDHAYIPFRNREAPIFVVHALNVRLAEYSVAHCRFFHDAKTRVWVHSH